MGVSTDGLLFWGIEFCDTEEEARPWAAGARSFWLRNKLEVTEEEDYFGEKTLAKLGFEIGEHCSYDFPIYYLAEIQTHLRANRGYSKRVPPLEYPDSDWWREKTEMLRIVCDRLDIRFKEPSWMLASLWG